MQILAAFVLCIALVLAPYTVWVELGAVAGGLPWKTFSESVKDTVAARPGSCGSERTIMTAQLERDGKTWMYYAAENGRFLFATLGDNGPVRIYVGAQLPSPDHDKIKVLDEHAYSGDRDSAGPCDHLFPQRS